MQRCATLVVMILALSILGTSVITIAQQPHKVARIGVLAIALPSEQLAALRQGLQEFGWIEGHNLVLEIRILEGQSAPLSALATELVDLQVDLICTGDGAAAHAAKKATETIPIVGASLGSTLEFGFVATLGHPGGNVTGLSLQTEGLPGIWFEVLKEVLPSVRRVALLHHTRPGTTPLEDFEATARSLGIELLPFSVQTAVDFQAAFQVASQRQVHALVLGGSPLFSEHVSELAALALAHRLPTISYESTFAAAGGLMNYGPRRTDNFHRAATFIDRILKGTRPDELPIERPMRFFLAINLKTAQALGLTIPQTLLSRADEVIQ